MESACSELLARNLRQLPSGFTEDVGVGGSERALGKRELRFEGGEKGKQRAQQ